MRGDPNTSQDIFKAMKKRNPAVNEEIVPINPASSSGGFTLSDNGGAFASMQRRKKVEETANKVEPVQIVRENKEIVTKRVISVEDLDRRIMETLYAVNDVTVTSGDLVRDLWALYFSDKLSGLSIKGVTEDRKTDILAVIDEFRSIVINTI